MKAIAESFYSCSRIYSSANSLFHEFFLRKGGVLGTAGGGSLPIYISGLLPLVPSQRKKITLKYSYVSARIKTFSQTNYTSNA